jgi:hypothetical protein
VCSVLESYAAVGVTDMYFYPTVPNLEQIDLLADALRAGDYLQQPWAAGRQTSGTNVIDP